ncbi:MAG: sigma-70 family RNA polymerase sigma factor [Deltaproteobacteria bacterium]|nr:sigma-70 family RNA polymerase sigma factor [Deltaproteobacteria bacterium]
MPIPRSASFPTTRWTRIVHASDPTHPRTQAAFAELFQLYAYPIYTFLRRKSGCGHEKAEDLLQEFFLYAYEHRTFGKADREKGRFRTFVQGCVENFLIDEHRYAAAAKRGGGVPHIDINGLEADARYATELADMNLSPEKLFEWKLALEIFNGAMAELESEAADESKSAIFAALREYLQADVGRWAKATVRSPCG